MAAGNLSAARFWYEAALGLKEDARKGAFVQKDYSGYIPLMQLCVIYDRLGLRDKAEAVNEQAALLKPATRRWSITVATFKTSASVDKAGVCAILCWIRSGRTDSHKPNHPRQAVAVPAGTIRAKEAARCFSKS